jgi:hypothetical protein
VEPGDAFENTAFQWFEKVTGCREAALRIFVKQMPPTDSWHQVDSGRCNFHPHASITPCFTVGKIPAV